MLRRYVRNSKNDPLVDEVELVEANPQYAHVRFPDGRESTVSVKDLAPRGEVEDTLVNNTGKADSHEQKLVNNDKADSNEESHENNNNMSEGDVLHGEVVPSKGFEPDAIAVDDHNDQNLRRSTRIVRPPNRLGY